MTIVREFIIRESNFSEYILREFKMSEVYFPRNAISAKQFI